MAIEIPQRFHTTIIGAKGNLVQSITDECGGVQIRFPSDKAVSDKVVIRGTKDGVERAKKRLLELANDRVCVLYPKTDWFNTIELLHIQLSV